MKKLLLLLLLPVLAISQIRVTNGITKSAVLAIVADSNIVKLQGTSPDTVIVQGAYPLKVSGLRSTGTVKLEGSLTLRSTIATDVNITGKLVASDSGRFEKTTRFKGDVTYGATSTSGTLASTGKITSPDSIVSNKGFRTEGTSTLKGQTLHGTGSDAAPELSSNNDTNTGIRFPGGDKMQLVQNGLNSHTFRPYRYTMTYSDGDTASLYLDGTSAAFRSNVNFDVRKLVVSGIVGTVANKNQYRYYLSDSTGAYLLYQPKVWSGSAWVDGINYGFGYSALYSNSGSYSNGFGYSALRNNSGSYGNGFGYAALQYNSGSYSNGFGYSALQNNSGSYGNGFGHYALRNNSGSYSNGFGYSALQNNSGSYSNGFGYSALQNNSGSYGNGFGYNALQYNQGSYNTAIGDNAFNTFNANSGAAKTFDYTSVRSTDQDTIFITSHGFGNASERVNLLYTQGTSAITGLTTNTVYLFKIIDANSICSGGLGVDITNVGTGTGHKLTPQYVYTNSTALGNNAEPTASNQVVLGNMSVTSVITSGYIGAGITAPAALLHANNANVLSKPLFRLGRDKNTTADSIAFMVTGMGKVSISPNTNTYGMTPADTLNLFSIYGKKSADTTFAVINDVIGRDSTWAILPNGNTASNGKITIDRTVSLTDAGEYTPQIPAGMCGWGTVQIGDEVEWARFRFKADGTVTLEANSTNVGTTNDVDAKLNIYDAGTSGIIIENQLGSTLTAAMVIECYTP